MKTKICIRCQVEKDLDDFRIVQPRKPPKKLTEKIMRQAKCRPCVANYASERYQKNPKSYADNLRRWKQKNPEKYILGRIKISAKIRGLKFNLDLADINIPSICPRCQCAITFDKKARRLPSVDRIESTKGYVKGNIEIICLRCNTQKNDSTEKERCLSVIHDLKSLDTDKARKAISALRSLMVLESFKNNLNVNGNNHAD